MGKLTMRLGNCFLCKRYPALLPNGHPIIIFCLAPKALTGRPSLVWIDDKVGNIALEFSQGKIQYHLHSKLFPKGDEEYDYFEEQQFLFCVNFGRAYKLINLAVSYMECYAQRYSWCSLSYYSQLWSTVWDPCCTWVVINPIMGSKLYPSYTTSQIIPFW